MRKSVGEHASDRRGRFTVSVNWNIAPQAAERIEAPLLEDIDSCFDRESLSNAHTDGIHMAETVQKAFGGVVYFPVSEKVR